MGNKADREAGPLGKQEQSEEVCSVGEPGPGTAKDLKARGGFEMRISAKGRQLERCGEICFEHTRSNVHLGFYLREKLLESM